MSPQPSQNAHETQAFDVTHGVLFAISEDNDGHVFDPPKIYLYLRRLNTSSLQLTYTHP
jgi:hypothetical protein